MAKAQDIDVAPSEPFRQAAARVVRVRADELFEYGDGVLDTRDIERVHDMRVATRRLRAVLEIFAVCFPVRAHRDVLRDVKALADALGERRDPDVQIAALEAHADGAPVEDRPGIEVLVGRLRAEQSGANADLAVALIEVERSDLRGRLAGLARAAAQAPDRAETGSGGA